MLYSNSGYFIILFSDNIDCLSVMTEAKMGNNTDLERCKKSLRSILLANKCGIPARLLFKEYSNLYEEDIPYKKFNFPSLGIN